MRNLLIFTLSLFTLLSCQKEKTFQYNTQRVTIPIEKEKTDNYKNIVWRESISDGSIIKIDSLYFNNISEEEKAVVGYIITFVGNECWWDGESTDERDNLKCTILDALKLGYQCSETHLGFLRTKFKNDKKVLEELESCPTIPYTATIQNTISEMFISENNDEISIKTKEFEINVRDDSFFEINKIYRFSTKNNQILFIGATEEVIEK